MLHINRTTKTIDIDHSYLYKNKEIKKNGILMNAVYSEIQNWLAYPQNMDCPVFISAVTSVIYILSHGWKIKKSLAELITRGAWATDGEIFCDLCVPDASWLENPVQLAYSINGDKIKRFSRPGLGPISQPIEVTKYNGMSTPVSIFAYKNDLLVNIGEYNIWASPTTNFVPTDSSLFLKKKRIMEEIRLSLSDIEYYEFLKMVDIKKFPTTGIFCGSCSDFLQQDLFSPEIYTCKNCYEIVREVINS